MARGEEKRKKKKKKKKKKLESTRANVEAKGATMVCSFN